MVKMNTLYDTEWIKRDHLERMKPKTDEESRKTAEFRERLKSITLTLSDDVIIGLEEFIGTYQDSLEALEPVGNTEGLILAIFDLVKKVADDD